ncbi:hypothetical protein F511_43301 [Dorcoceras hygrometricum]|uniref:Uncharacterized protein n=1 Tax=Dorcoceras hygrometricum TaxID=472368 RepID=A0A2Z7BCN1_9LAMI|nr:hypothetical protein F511_43301 [Dorcoceras hygrometricum]
MPPCAAAAASSRRNSFRPIRRGESVRAEFVSASSAASRRSLGSGRGPDWRYLPQSTEKSRVLVIPVGARHKCQQDIRF